MTQSISRAATSGGIARRAISRPGLPKMSPMNRMRNGSVRLDRDANLAAAAFLDPRQRHPQLAGGEPGAGGGAVECAGQAHGPHEAAEGALGQMEGGIAVFAG